MKRLSITFSMLLVPGMLLAQTQPLTLDDLLSAGSGRRSTGQLSPDGRFFAREEQGQIALVPVNGGHAKIITSSPKPKSELQWSHDGKHIAYISEGDVWIGMLRFQRQSQSRLRRWWGETTGLEKRIGRPSISL